MKRVADKVMPVSAIHGANVALLSLLIVGVPAVTGVSLGALRLSSNTWLERLVAGGLILGVAVNGIAGWWARRRPPRLACRGWMFVHATVLIVALATQAGWINFDWLKAFLRGLGQWL